MSRILLSIMGNFGRYIKNWREQHQITMMEFAQLLEIDQALISKYENGKRLPSEKHLLKFSAGMDRPLHEIRKEFLAEKIYQLISAEENPYDILKAAEPRIQYLSSKKVLQIQALSQEVQEKLAQLDELQKQWVKAKPLNVIQLQKMREYFDVNYTYDSNRIEGNTLTLQETHLVVNEGITIGGKSMREHLEAINHYEAIDFIREMVNGQEGIDKRSLLDIHRLVLKSIDSENAGKYRKVGVRISGSDHVPPDALLLDQLMDDFYNYYLKNKNTLHPVILAAEMHERLVSIHPFIDGNGRTARLLMNFILMNNGYTVTILKGDLNSRLAYYQALEQVQVHNDPTPFYLMIIDKVRESLVEHLEMV